MTNNESKDRIYVISLGYLRMMFFNIILMSNLRMNKDPNLMTTINTLLSLVLVFN